MEHYQIQQTSHIYYCKCLTSYCKPQGAMPHGKMAKTYGITNKYTMCLDTLLLKEIKMETNVVALINCINAKSTVLSTIYNLVLIGMVIPIHDLN